MQPVFSINYIPQKIWFFHIFVVDISTWSMGEILHNPIARLGVTNLADNFSRGQHLMAPLLGEPQGPRRPSSSVALKMVSPATTAIFEPPRPSRMQLPAVPSRCPSATLGLRGIERGKGMGPGSSRAWGCSTWWARWGCWGIVGCGRVVCGGYPKWMVYSGIMGSFWVPLFQEPPIWVTYGLHTTS